MSKSTFITASCAVRISLKKTLFFLLFFLLVQAANVFAQGAWNIIVDGRVVSGSTRLAKASIKLYKNGAVVKKTQTPPNGKFTLVLKPDIDYIIEIGKVGYVSKKISFSTKDVPPEKVGVGFRPFEMTIDLFREVEGLDISILDKPIGKIRYYTKPDDFQFDKIYTKQMHAQLARLEKELAVKQKEAAKKASAEAASAAVQAQSDSDAKEKADAKAKAAADAGAKKKAEEEAKSKAAADAAAKKKAEEEAKSKAAADAAAKKKAEEEAKSKAVAEAAAKKKAEEEAKAKAEAAAVAKAKAAADVKARADAEAKAAADARAKAAAVKKKAEEDARAKVAAEAAAKKKAKEAAAVIAAAEAEAKRKAEEMARKNAENAEKQQALDDKYNTEITNADKAFANKDYTYARNMYKAASTIKPNEQYPKDKIREIDKEVMMAAQKQALEDAKSREKEQQYEANITEGDLALKKKDYTLAKQNFNEALAIKSGEKYPADKLKEIETIIAANAKAEEEATARAAAEAASKKKAEEEAKAKAAAEAAAKKKAEEEAKAKAKAAAAKKKAEEEATAKAAKEAAAKSKAAEEKALNAKYNAAIVKGDKFFKAKKYDDANAFYQEASNLKEDETYPKDRIAEIQKIQDGLVKAKTDAQAEKAENEKRYNSNIKNGDMSMKFKEYSDAKQFYSEASRLKPEQEYPKTKLAEIVNLLSTQKIGNQKKEELKKQYDAAITRGDKNYAAKDWEVAKKAYNNALVLKADASYPKDKIADIDLIIKTERDRKAAEETARSAAEAKAKAAAEAAANKKAEEEAKARAAIEAVAKKKAEEEDKAKAEAEAEARKRAEEAAKAKVTAEAAAKKKAEEDALARAAAEEEARKKAAEQKKAEAAAKAKTLDDKYHKLIADADKAFQNKDYDAIQLYKSALNMKPNEKYPKEKIAEINQILEGVKANEAEYQQKISEGNKNFAEKNYFIARGYFEEALKLKPAENYPVRKIEEIKAFMDKLAAKKAAQEAAHKKAEDDKKAREAKEKANQEEIARQKALKAKQITDAAVMARAHRQKEREAALSMTPDERERMLSELALEYPEGMTEEKYTDGQKKIIRRIVVFEGRADVYKMVIQPWGARFYFKNHASIPKHQFYRETDDVDL